MKEITLIAVLFLAFSCNENAKKAADEPQSKEVKQEEVAKVEVPQQVLETMPNEMRIDLIENVTGVEATMYESGGSFSLTDLNSAKNFVNFIKNEAPKQLTKQQVGHVLLHNQGEQLLLLMVFRDNDIVYTKYTDTESNKTYYNLLTGQPSDLFLNVEIKKVAE